MIIQVDEVSVKGMTAYDVARQMAGPTSSWQKTRRRTGTTESRGQRAGVRGLTSTFAISFLAARVPSVGSKHTTSIWCTATREQQLPASATPKSAASTPPRQVSFLLSGRGRGRGRGRRRGEGVPGGRGWLTLLARPHAIAPPPRLLPLLSSSPLKLRPLPARPPLLKHPLAPPAPPPPHPLPRSPPQPPPTPVQQAWQRRQMGGLGAVRDTCAGEGWREVGKGGGGGQTGLQRRSVLARSEVQRRLSLGLLCRHRASPEKKGVRSRRPGRL